MITRSLFSRRQMYNVARGGAVLSAVMLAMNLLAVFDSAPAASAAGTNNGTVSFSNTDNVAITSGGSANFNLVLPGTAACPGSGADGYRWQGFLVAAAVDPGALVFGAGPQPVGTNFVASLQGTDGQFLRNRFPAAEPVGLITGVPTINFVPFPVPGTLPAGTYKIGIACTRTQETLSYWATTITVTQNNSDSPAKIAWSVQATPPPTTVAPTTVAPTTVAPTTVAPTTVAPTTVAPTTTVRPSTTTTTVAGATTTTVSGATTTTSVASGGPTTTVRSGGGSFPVTGSSQLPAIVWAILFLVFGRMALLLAKPVRVLPPKQ